MGSSWKQYSYFMAAGPDASTRASEPASEVLSERPTHEGLREDLAVVRTLGAARLRGQELPALRQAAVLLDLCDQDDQEPAPLVTLLRDALDLLGGGVDQDAAEYLLGLAPGTGRWSLTRRRAEAASLLLLQPDTFRKKPEQLLLDDIAEHILELLHESGLRQARTAMEAKRHPADSRLAVQWVERFEAYYRLWTPAYALAADLEAALETYCEPVSEHPPWDPGNPTPYDPVYQGDGYALQALYHYAHFKLEEKRFMSRHGGLWLASSVEIEQQIADAVYRIGWHNSFNEKDDAWLRRHLADARREETDHFLGVVMSLSKGVRVVAELIALARQGVKWKIEANPLPRLGGNIPEELRVSGETIAEALTEEELSQTQVGQTMRAARDYVRLIDEDWVRIADWYRPGSTPRRGVSGMDLYDSHLKRQTGPRGADDTR